MKESIQLKFRRRRKLMNNRKALCSALILILMLTLAMSASAQDVTVKWFMRWDQNRVENVAMPVSEAFTEATGIGIEFENIGSGRDYYTKLQDHRPPAARRPTYSTRRPHVANAYASKGALLTIDEFVERDGIDLSVYDPTILANYMIDGELHCLPIDHAALVVYYNKEIFDAAGVDYPQDGWTWDDFLATAQALTLDTDGDGVTDQFGVDTFRNYWPMVVWSNTDRGLFDDIRHPTEFLRHGPGRD